MGGATPAAVPSFRGRRLGRDAGRRAPGDGLRRSQADRWHPLWINVYVEDADATLARAIERGAIPLLPVEDQFYGDRTGQFEDPWGHRWGVATHIEDVSPEEMERRTRTMG
jgi:PhnB protein